MRYDSNHCPLYQKLTLIVRMGDAMETKWVRSDLKTFAAIFKAHKNELELHSTFTNMEPSNLGEPQMRTAYQFKGSDHGIIKVIERWEHGDRDNTAEFKYYIGYGICDECSEI